MFESVKNCGVGKFVSNGIWTHPSRVMDSYELIFVTKGEVFLNENKTDYHLKPDDALILCPDLLHFGYKGSTDTEFFWLHWHSDKNVLTNFKYKKIENPYTISLYFRQLINAREMQKPSESMDYLTRLILIELYSSAAQSATRPILDKVIAWINANIHTRITERNVADKFGYNVDYLNRIFKQSYSKTIKQYINSKRMEYIKNLMLRSDLSLQEIAIQSGFSEYKYFLKFFKYHEKITPTQLYKQYSKLHMNSR